MKFTKKFRAAACGVTAAVMIGAAAVASYAYDGSSDPVISLSYLKLYKQTEIDPQITTLNDRIAVLESQIQQLAMSSTIPSVVNAGGYEVIEVPYGTRVIAAEPCDIMLRSGSAQAVSSFAEQGISDYTAGAELMNGDAVTINHMLLIPRGGDGRGILVTSNTAFIMIRGAYTLES